MLSVLLMSSKETKIIAFLLLLLIQPPPHIKSEVPQLFSFPTKSKSAKEMEELQNDNITLPAELDATTAQLSESERKKNSLRVSLEEINYKVQAQLNFLQRARAAYSPYAQQPSLINKLSGQGRRSKARNASLVFISQLRGPRSVQGIATARYRPIPA